MHVIHVLVDDLEHEVLFVLEMMVEGPISITISFRRVYGDPRPIGGSIRLTTEALTTPSPLDTFPSNRHLKSIGQPRE